MVLKLVTACQSLKKMMPEGATISAKERTAILHQKQHDITYLGAAKVDFPVFPIQAWAATYELDIILVSQNPLWNMHEYAKLATPQGDLWLMKDAAEPSLDQYITADLPNINAWLPELPVLRKSYPIKVIDNSTTKWLDLSFSYENIKGQKIEASYQGKYPKTVQKKKNGSTMGHSKNQLLVALDLPYRDFGKKATISYDGKAYKIKKILGLLPFQMALKQTQGGLSSGSYRIFRKENKIISSHQTQAEAVRQHWTVEEKDSLTVLEQKNDFRTVTYIFENKGESLALKVAYVQQWNKKEKGVRIEFSPALPDIRRPFEGKITSKFVLDIAGENNNAIGSITAEWQGDKALLTVLPSQPWWVRDRAMQTTIEYKDKEAIIDIKMMGERD